MQTRTIFLLASAFFATTAIISPEPALATSLGDMLDNSQKSLEEGTSFLEILSYLIGIVLVITGLLRFKRHSDYPQQVSLGSAIVVVLVGVALIALPALASALIETTGATNNSIQKPNFGN